MSKFNEIPVLTLTAKDLNVFNTDSVYVLLESDTYPKAIRISLAELKKFFTHDILSMSINN